VKTHWFLSGGVFLSIESYSNPLFKDLILRSCMIKAGIISVRHIIVLLQLYQSVKIVRNKAFKPSWLESFILNNYSIAMIKPFPLLVRI